MTIQEIKKSTQITAPLYFSSGAMKFFGQRLKDFTVTEQDDGRFSYPRTRQIQRPPHRLRLSQAFQS